MTKCRICKDEIELDDNGFWADQSGLLPTLCADSPYIPPRHEPVKQVITLELSPENVEYLINRAQHDPYSPDGLWGYLMDTFHDFKRDNPL